MNHPTAPIGSLGPNNEEPQPWHSEVPTEKTKIAQAIEGILNPKSYLVKEGDSLQDVEQALGIMLGQSLLFGVRGLTGKTIQYNGKTVLLPSGTSFPVRPMMNVLH